MFVDNSVDWVLSQRPLCVTLVRILRTLSLMFAYSRRMTLVLRRPLHSVVSDRNVLGIFVQLPPAVLIWFTHEETLHWRLLGPNFFSQCCVYHVSLTVTKHLDFWPTLYKQMWLQGFYLRTLLLGSKCWILTRHIHPMGIWFPIENSDVSWKSFPGRSSLIPIRRALIAWTSWTLSFIFP